MRTPRTLLPPLLALCATACEPGSNRDLVADPPTPLPAAARSNAAAAASASDEPAPEPGSPRTLPPDAVKLARSVNSLGFDLYARTRAEPGNLVISPTSLWTALAMAWAGSKGVTAAEMSRVLRLSEPPAIVAREAGKLCAYLNDPSQPFKLHVVNRLFGEQSYRFEHDYLSLVREAFGAPLESVDFRTAHEPARRRVNGWVAEQTEERIRDLIPPGGVGPDTRLVLVNAIYFLGTWATAFPKEATAAAPFSLANGMSKEVPTMHQRAPLRAARAPGVHLVEIPYLGERLAMTIVVPDSPQGLATVEASLSAPKLEEWTSGLRRSDVDLSLPRFVIDPSGSLELASELKALGMPSAFDPATADFTAMANPSDGAPPLYFSAVFHKGFVAVDEQGTEAAAATAIVMTEGAAVPPPPITVKADRPFLFFIRDVASGLVLFQGRVEDPSLRG